jgi:hypothetical protein
MATCNQVIDFALRKLAVLTAGRFANAVQANNALIALRSIYAEHAAQGLYGVLKTRRITTSPYDAAPGDRVVYQGVGTLTLNLPETVEEDCDGLRVPRDLAVIVEAGADPKTWLYDADIGEWVSIHSLTGASPAPLSLRLLNGLAAMLAVRIAPEWNVQAAPQVVADASGAKNTLAMQWSEPRDVVKVEYF